jgi:hypothetical protein
MKTKRDAKTASLFVFTSSIFTYKKPLNYATISFFRYQLFFFRHQRCVAIRSPALLMAARRKVV